jgi:hypothetical protein
MVKVWIVSFMLLGVWGCGGNNTSDEPATVYACGASIGNALECYGTLRECSDQCAHECYEYHVDVCAPLDATKKWGG